MLTAKPHSARRTRFGPRDGRSEVIEDTQPVGSRISSVLPGALFRRVR